MLVDVQSTHGSPKMRIKVDDQAQNANQSQMRLMRVSKAEALIDIIFWFSAFILIFNIEHITPVQ